MASQAPGMPRVAGFKVLKLLGKGSYGKVYKVQRDSDDQYYALKETDLGAMNQLERADAVNEVRLLVSINHANVIRYNDSFLNGNKLCVIMEYAPFGDLRYYISKGQRLNAPFPEEAVWRIFLQLCRGLAHLHSNNIIHRDIKPANIFLCANDLLKIGDLGVAKALTHLNFARTQIGTPSYMAPEVWSGRPYSYSSDLFSLGCVLYEMMTFKVPFEGRSMQDLKLRICSGRFPPVPPGKYSAELTSFCHGLLSMDPKRRPSIQTIMTSASGQRWMRVLPNAPAAPPAPLARVSSNGKQLLDTIVVPRDLRELPKKLPPASYESDIARQADVAPRSSSGGLIRAQPARSYSGGLSVAPSPRTSNSGAGAPAVPVMPRISSNGGGGGLPPARSAGSAPALPAAVPRYGQVPPRLVVPAGPDMPGPSSRPSSSRSGNTPVGRSPSPSPAMYHHRVSAPGSAAPMQQRAPSPSSAAVYGQRRPSSGGNLPQVRPVRQAS